MKLTVKTLKGSHFEIRVLPTATIMAVKKNIEDVQGKDNYPCGQQLLIHNGKVLKDETTLADNKVTEDGFLVVMLSKSKNTNSSGTSSVQPTSTTAPTSNSTSVAVAPSQALPDTQGQAASSIVADNDLEQTIQHMLDIGDGSWDRQTIMRALQAAYNNPARAIDYLYYGLPETAEVAAPISNLPANQNASSDNSATEFIATGVTPLSGGPNSSPLNLFPQEMSSDAAAAGNLGSLDFLRNNEQFHTLRNMVQSNPQILQPMLQELGKQNPQMLRLIQENQEEFLQLINDPIDDAPEGDLFEQPDMGLPHEISVTAEEQAAIERLEAMGFDKSLVIEAFLACDRNEELAANYLLESAAEFED